jgi:hypothetical protein
LLSGLIDHESWGVLYNDFYERRFGRLELTHCGSNHVSHLTPFSLLCALIFQSFGVINTLVDLSMAVCNTCFFILSFSYLCVLFFGVVIIYNPGNYNMSRRRNPLLLRAIVSGV